MFLSHIVDQAHKRDFFFQTQFLDTLGGNAPH